MARPRLITPGDVAFWAAQDGVMGQVFTIGGPAEGPTVIPCPTLVATTAEGRLFHVAIELEPEEVRALLAGGTLWMTTLGGLPVHGHQVTIPSDPATAEVLERVEAFHRDLKDRGLHVGVGNPPTCVTCDVPWPCTASEGSSTGG